jgi:RHS repeat-associated protein
MHFTGQERDTETNLDNFGARYHASSVGHLMSPDPDSISGFAYQDDPQSWNGYAYARNNPLFYTDPSGALYCHEAEFVGQLTCSDDNKDKPPQPAVKCGLLCHLGKIFGGGGSSTHAGGIVVSFPLFSSGATRLAPIGPITFAAAAVIGSAAALSVGIRDAQIENAQGREQLAAIESIVAVENARRLLLAKLAHTHFSSEQSKIRAAAAIAGITCEKLSDYLHSFKEGPHGAGRGPGENFTWKELVAIALEAAQWYESQK